MKNIGFIGIGTMGKGMVQNLLKNSFKVFVYNRTRSKAEEINHDNLVIVDAPKELPANTEVIITCVSDDVALKDVLFSDNGLFQTLNKNNIIVDSGTTSSDLTKEIEEKAKEKNVHFLDAPITGSKLGAESGQILFMVGGQKEVFEKCNPLWDAMGRKAIYCGINGYGQKAKYALNLTQALILESYLEGLIFGMKNNVPFNVMNDVLDSSTAKSGVSTFKIPYILKRDFEPHFLFKLMHKDLKFAEKEFKKLNINFPLTNQIFKQFQKGHENGLDDQDLCSLVKLLEEEAGLKVGEQ